MSQNFRVIQSTDRIADSRIYINNNFDALKTSFSGPTSPATPSTGQIWYDTTNGKLKYYDGSSWIHVEKTSISNLAAASTLNIGAESTSAVISIIGSATINSLGTAAYAGMIRTLIFSNNVTIQPSSNLILPNNTELSLPAGSTAIFVAESTTTWRLINNISTSSGSSNPTGSNLSNTTIDGDLFVKGNTTLGDAGTDTITIRGDVAVRNDVNTISTFTIDNNTGNTVIAGNLSVNGNVTLGDSGVDLITIRGDVAVRNDLNSAFTFTIDNNTGNTVIAGDLVINGTRTFTTTPTANAIPVSKSDGKLDINWLPPINQTIVHTSDQAWINVTSQRSPGITYTNTTGKYIIVSVVCRLTSTSCDLSDVAIYVNNLPVAHVTPSCVAYVYALVPPNATYMIEKKVNATISGIYEFR